MLNIEISKITSAVVEQELRGKGREKEALYFHFDLRLSYHHTADKALKKGGNIKTYNTSRGLHLLYHCNPHSNYITAFSAVVDNPFTNKIHEWEHECSHDSCWRDIRVFTSTYFAMAEEINTQLHADKIRKVAPIKMQENNSIFGFSRLYSWVPVQVSIDTTDTHNYRKKLVITR